MVFNKEVKTSSNLTNNNETIFLNHRIFAPLFRVWYDSWRYKAYGETWKCFYWCRSPLFHRAHCHIDEKQ